MTHEELERENVDCALKDLAAESAACLHPTGKYYAPIKTARLIFISTQVGSVVVCVNAQCERVVLR